MKRKFIYLSSINVMIIILIINICVINSENITAQGLDVKKYLGLNKTGIKKYSGENICIAILDSGMAIHDDINRNRVVFFKDFVNYRDDIYDDNGHGTFIAGIIAANGKLKGIAPYSKLVILKVLDKQGKVDIEKFYHAIKWLADNSCKYDIRIINISMGINEIYIKYYRNKFLKLFDELINNNVILIASAGNTKLKNKKMTFPATCNNIISVGALNNNKTYNRKDDYVASFSQYYANKPDVFTFGVNIKSLNFTNHSGYKIMSGTSYSAAIVTGVVALLLEKYDGKVTKERIISYFNVD